MTRAYNTATTQQNSGGAVPAFVAGKNKIINGDFGIWQRGTSFTNPTTGDYTADRWRISNLTAITTSRNVTQQTFTPGTAPVAGYEGTYFLRSDLITKGSSAGARINQRIEDVRTFAGQTFTISFWAKSDAARTNNYIIGQNFGSGGSTAVTVTNTKFSTTTSWTRFTGTFAMPSISGKTVGTNSFVDLLIQQENTDGCVLDIWGVQMEVGSIATPFQTATGTIQGELAACQRYYWLFNSGSSTILGTTFYQSASRIHIPVLFPVTMRVAPSLSATSGTNYYNFQTSGDDNFNSLTIGAASPQSAYLFNNTEVSGTAGQAGMTLTNNASTSVAFSAEL